jgi:cysteinyl-tRNA synthetase
MMKLRLYNTLTRKERVFKPLDSKNVRIYVCGPTVYDFAHIGNARPVIVFDVMFRLLRHLAKQGVWDEGKCKTRVTYVRNITDVDDKINARAAEEYPALPLNKAIRKVTDRTTRQFHDDVDLLGCLRPTKEPRATKHIEEMKRLIKRLINKKRAYVLDDHVLFQVKGVRSYGRLSHRSLKDMRSSARGDVAPKRNSMDFVLWKPSKPGEPSWPSPGRIRARGRPGWHIECSAMSWKYLGMQFDIHGGGIDLLFPHHENERAQSCQAFDRHEMAQVWMHNGFLQVEGEKMSKSLGNFVTIHELLQAWPGEVLRLQMLGTHYRRPLDWTSAKDTSAQSELEDWVIRIENVLGKRVGRSRAKTKVSEGLIEALCKDLNTPGALAFLRQKVKKIGNDPKRALSFLCDCEFLGLLNRRNMGLLSREFGGQGASPELMVDAYNVYQSFRPKLHNRLPGAKAEFEKQIRELGGEVKYLEDGGVHLVQTVTKTSKINDLIAQRDQARARKDWEESDRVRDELAKMNVALKDTPQGTTWSYVLKAETGKYDLSGNAADLTVGEKSGNAEFPTQDGDETPKS